MGFTHRMESTSALDTQTTVEKQPYQPPYLTEWGTVEDLTAGGLGGTVDGNLTGTGGA